MVKSVTIDRLPVTGTINDSDLLIVRSVADGVTRQITKLQLFSELHEDVGDVLENYGVRSIVPALDGAYDLGSVAKTWRDLYIDGTLYAGNIVGQLDSSITFDSSYFAGILDSDFVLSVTADAFSGIVSRIDLDSDRLDAQISRITDLSLNLSALDSDYAAYKIATADAFDELYVRIYLDSDRLSTVAGDLTVLQTNVSNLDLLAFDSDGVAAMIDSATSIVRSELISRIDITDSSVLILAGDISDLQVQASLLDSAILVNGSAISSLTTRIDLTESALSVVSQDYVGLRADLDNLDLRDSAWILGRIDSATAAAESRLIARIDVTDSSVLILAGDISDLQVQASLLDSAILVNGSAISSLTTRIELDSDRLSVISADVVDLRADLSNVGGVDSGAILGIVDSAVSSARSELISRIELDSARLTLLSSDVTTLTNSLSLLQDSVAANSSAVSGLTSRIDFDSARLSLLSSDVTTLSNTVSNLQLGGIDSALVATLIDSAVSIATTELNSRIDADSASLVLVASRVTSLENEVRFDSSSVATTSAYTDLVSRVDADSDKLSLVSGSVSTFQVQLNDLVDSVTNTATLTNSFDTRITSTENGIADIAAEWYLTTNVNGYVSGVKLTNTGDSSEFVVQTDRFKVINSSNQAIQPFTVSGDTVYMTNVVASNLTLGADTSNLLENPGFEFDSIGWQTVGTLTWTSVAESPKTGTSSAKITATANNDFLESTTRIPASPGESFYADAYVRSTVAGAQVQVFIVYYDASNVANGSFTSTSAFTTTTSYQKISVSMDSAPENTAYVSVRIRFGTNSNGKTIYVDDVRLIRKTNSELIVNGSITTDKLLVTGRGSALNSDPNMVDPSAWERRSGSSSGTFTTVSDGLIGLNIFRSGNPGSVGSWYNGSERLRLDPNKTYRMTGVARKSTNADGKLFIGIDAFESDGARISGDGTAWSYGAANGVPASSMNGDWNRYSVAFGSGTNYQFPTEARSFAPLFILNYQSTTGYMEIQDVRIEEQIPASLIVDGTIAASKLVITDINTSSLNNDAGFTDFTKDSADALITSKGYQTSAQVATIVESYNYSTFDATDVQAAITNNVTTIDGAKITTGTIGAARIDLNLGRNLITDIANFDLYGPSGEIPGATSGTATVVTGEVNAVHGKYVLKYIAEGSNTSNFTYITPYPSFSANTWVRVEGGKRYILSCYVRTTSTSDITVSVSGRIGAYGTGGTTYTGPTATIKDTDGWVRISKLLNAVPAGDNNAYSFYVRNTNTTATTYWDAFQLEEWTGDDAQNANPSPFNLPGATTIDGGSITTGRISADRIDTTGLVVASQIADFVTGDSVDDFVVNPTNFNLNKTTTSVGRTTVKPDGILIESWNGSAFVKRVKLGNLSVL